MGEGAIAVVQEARGGDPARRSEEEEGGVVGVETVLPQEGGEVRERDEPEGASRGEMGRGGPGGGEEVGFQ